jgi:glycosyltransferase involved in cell wall biosynthesis
MPVPLLIISDAPTSGTGLGRITRDLATRIATHIPDVFRVGTMGYGGPYSRALPFPQYNMDMKDWVLFNLPEVWQDFAGIEQGIVMTIWDASRLLWFSRPENCPDSQLRKWLQEANFDTWGYFPIDATGPHDRLTAVIKHTIEGYDRALAYSKWAEDILRRTLWKKPLLESLTNLPHGIDTSIFYPRDRAKARAEFGERLQARAQSGKWMTLPDNMFMVGIVGTNQVRKDHGLGIQIVAELARDRNAFVWIHTDQLERHWSIPALLNDFGLIKSHVVTTMPYTDEQMAWAYSACDVTLGIGLGEGYGYPIFESLACGTPCFHGNYGGAPEHMPKRLVCQPEMYHLEGVYNSVRPLFIPQDWAEEIRCLQPQQWSLPEHLDWNNLWPRWEEWFRKGIE